MTYLGYASYETRDNGRTQVRIRNKRDNTSTIIGTYDTREEAEQAANKYLTENNASELWREAIARQHRQALKASQIDTIAFPNEPILIAFPSDLHIGSRGVDYETLLSDTNLIAETDGAYAVFVGDGTDNWIVGKLTSLQRDQSMAFDDEVALFADWLRIISPKMKAVVSGNHDLWTKKMAGIDPLAAYAKSINALYGQHHVLFDLAIGSIKRRVLVRHKWRGSSVFNPTHGLEVGWERGDINFDWAVGGHTHIGTLMRPFDRHGKRRCAILIGTYKAHDGYADELGLPSPKGRGCGAMIVHPDGREWFFAELREAIEFLMYLRSKWR